MKKKISQKNHIRKRSISKKVHFIKIIFGILGLIGTALIITIIIISHKSAVLGVSTTKTATLKMAVILYNYKNDNSQLITPQQAQEEIFDNNNPFSTSMFIRESSDEKVFLTGKVFGWYTVPYDTDRTTCPDAGVDYLIHKKDLQSILSFSQYNIVVLATNLITNCEYGAHSEGGSTDGNIYVYRFTNIKHKYGYLPTLLDHEMGHVLGIGHATGCLHFPSCLSELESGNNTPDIVEYGDPFDVMGSGRGHDQVTYQYSAIHKYQLGWKTNIQIVTKAQISHGYQYFIKPLEFASSNAGIEIPFSISGDKKPYSFFLEYRQPRSNTDSFNDYISSTVFSGVSIRIGTSTNVNHSLCDLDQEDVGTQELCRTMLIIANPNANGNFLQAPLPTGNTFYDYIHHISIRTISTNASGASVYIKYDPSITPTPTPIKSCQQTGGFCLNKQYGNCAENGDYSLDGYCGGSEYCCKAYSTPTPTLVPSVFISQCDQNGGTCLSARSGSCADNGMNLKPWSCVGSSVAAPRSCCK